MVNAAICCVSAGRAAKYTILFSLQGQKRSYLPVESRQANAFSGCVTGHRDCESRIENQNTKSNGASCEGFRFSLP